MRKQRRLAEQSLAPFPRPGFFPVRRTEQGSEHGAPVDIVSAEHGVGDESLVWRVVIFGGEVDRCWNAVGEVAGGAQMGTDDVLGGLLEPSFERKAEVGARLAGVPVADHGEEVRATEHFENQIDDQSSRFGSCGSRMRQGEVLLRKAERGRWIVAVKDRERNDPRKSADVLPLDRATVGFFALGVVEEKSAVTFLDVGVAVTSGRGEKIEITAGVVIEIVAALFEEGVLQQGG